MEAPQSHVHLVGEVSFNLSELSVTWSPIKEKSTELNAHAVDLSAEAFQCQTLEEQVHKENITHSWKDQNPANKGWNSSASPSVQSHYNHIWKMWLA